VFPVGAEAIVSLALVVVLQHFVGFVDFLELFFRARRRVDIGMVLTRQLAVSLLDVARVGATGNAQNLIIILVFHVISG
jgi:hypothetical protein